MNCLRILAVTALAVAIAGYAGWSSAQETTARKGDGHAAHFQDCAKACHECARVCDMCSAHCAELVGQGRREHLPTLATCQDCATICNAAAAITARMGPFSDAICTACADVCKRCGDVCAKHPSDPIMKQCADECYKCEKACREMLKHVGHGAEKR
jgi:Domain of Unknown Function (DUF326)